MDKIRRMNAHCRASKCMNPADEIAKTRRRDGQNPPDERILSCVKMHEFRQQDT